MQRTIVVRRDYLHYVPKYNRYEKRHRNIPVHCSPAFSVKEGDIVVIGQCRPLCKTVHFNVLKVIPNEIVGNVRKQFMLFWSLYSTNIIIIFIKIRWKSFRKQISSSILRNSGFIMDGCFLSFGYFFQWEEYSSKNTILTFIFFHTFLLTISHYFLEEEPFIGFGANLINLANGLWPRKSI